MLNVIGRRMRATPRARLTITGTNADVGDEKGALALSRQRAETIRKYFTDVWGIDSKRLTVKARNLPADPSVVDNPEGQEENRRVELASDDPSITEPIRREEIVYNASLAALDFIPTVSAPNGIDRWSIDARQGNRVLFSAADRGATIPASWRWDLKGDQFGRQNAPLHVTFTVHDATAQEKTVTRDLAINTLTIEQKRQEKIGDVLVNRTKLILFDFDKANISKRNRDIINEVSKSVTSNSKVTILGYTDRIGTPEYNLSLSQQRAESARAAFGKTLDNVRVETKGLGSSQLLFPNDTPEGRFFCRMVVVIIESPAK
jgi:outer membrane protein OmpA-like peptidoglycan-associated protein